MARGVTRKMISLSIYGRHKGRLYVTCWPQDGGRRENWLSGEGGGGRGEVERLPRLRLPPRKVRLFKINE